MTGLAVSATAWVVVLALAGCGTTDDPPVAGELQDNWSTIAQSTRPPTGNSPGSDPIPTGSETTTTRPVPDGDVRNDTLLGANPMFVEEGVGIAQIDCQLPAWRNTPDANQSYYQAAIECHDNTWRQTLSRFGLTLEPPRLWTGASAQTYDGACGNGGVTREAFYCDMDQTIVMPFDTMSRLTGSANGDGAAFAVLSHEYGHHLQQLIGVLGQYSAQRGAMGWNSEAGLRTSRQLELQAWCFSGMFFGVNLGHGTISRNLWKKAYNNNSGAGDRPGESREHGTNRNVSTWFGWGFRPTLDQNQPITPSLYECNPWAARDAGGIE